MAVETARDAGTEADAELALYLVHGLLHLCGLDDRNEAERAADEDERETAGARRAWAALPV